MTNQDKLKQVFDEINEKLGGALRPLKSNSKVVGRDKELKELNIIMNRRDTPVGLLLAPAGAGKTALVGAMINEREAYFHKHVEVFELKIGLMASEGQQVLMTRMNTLLDNLKLYQDELQKTHPDGEVILFIDEVHTSVSIFGPGTKIGGDLLKDSLARAEEFIKVIAATTNDEFDRYIASDKPLARRFKPISLQEVDKNVTFDILRGWLKAKSVKGEDLNTIVDDETLKYIITNNAAYRPDQHEPAKSIDTLATIHSMHIVDGDPIDKKLVEKAFRTQYDVRLDFSVDAERVFNHIASRVKGQPLALWNMKTMVRNLSFDLEPNTDTPRATAIFPGTTGTGKSVYHDTDILSTRDGVTKYRKHGDLVVGDYVFNRKGQPVKVVGVYPQGMQRAYKVTFRNGASVICNDEHLWTYQNVGGNGGTHWKTTELKHIMSEDFQKLRVPKFEELTSIEDIDTPVISDEDTFIQSIEDLGHDLPMQCIMVDDPEHLYCVTRDFIVTHNTETTKAAAEALYGSEDAIVRVDMVDYGAENMDERFRRILGRAVSHKPSSIVLLDELEKAHPDVLNVLLPILDEGHLKYNDLGADGYEAEYNVSFKNTIIIATSNAAADALSEMDKYANVKITGQTMTDEFEEYSRNIEDQIIKALQSYGLRPEFIQRFKSIVPFASLSEATLIDITKNMILKKLTKFRDIKGYDVRIPPNKDWSDRDFKYIADAVTMYVVFERMNTEDANRSGARRIKNIIDKEVVGTIIEGIYENPSFTKFNLRTDGNCTFENPNHAQSKGRLVLEPKG